MSALAGILAEPGKEGNPTILASMAAAMKRFGPDELSISSEGAVHMAFCSFGWESRLPTKPQPVKLSGMFATFAGRLDNRKDLIKQLFADHNEAEDGEIVIHAYVRWGMQFCEKLIGDFALAVWDAGLQRLILARDPLGIRTLYVARVNGCFLWASSTDGILAHSEVNRSIDDLFIASYLDYIVDHTRSPFSAIRPVKPGHMLVIEQGKFSEHQYWTISDSLETIRYRDDGQYEEHFLAVFKQAVNDRLVPGAAVVAELSGGLDSSSITCVADLLLKQKENGQLKTLSYLYEGSLRTDERCYISEVEKNIRASHYHIEETSDSMLSGSADDDFIAVPSTILCFPGKATKPYEVFAECQARVVLSGEAGDAAFRNDEMYPTELAGEIFRRPPGAIVSVLSAWARSERTTLWQMAMGSIFIPAISSRSVDQPPLPNWLDPGLVRRSGLSDYRRSYATQTAGITPVYRARHCATILKVRSILSAGLHGYQTSKDYAEVRYPYLDTRLLSFLLSIPPDQLWRPNDRRSILRRSLRGILPEEIRARVGKATATEPMMVAIHRNWPWILDLLNNSTIAQAGYVVEDKLKKVLDDARQGIGNVPVQLLRCLSVEIWLRNIARTGSSVVPAAHSLAR